MTPPGLGPRLTPPGAPTAPPNAKDLVKTEFAGMWRDASGQALVGIRVALAPHWHVYWTNPGDDGMPTRLTPTLPSGWTSGATVYPRPDTFKGTDSTTFGYEERAVFLVPLTAAPDAKAGAGSIAVKFLVCKDVCQLGESTVPITLPDPSKLAALPALPETLDGRSFPKPLASSGGSASLKGGMLSIRGAVPASSSAADAMFIPFAFPGFTLPDRATVPGAVKAKAFEFDIKVGLDPNDSPAQPLKAGGLVTLGAARSDPCFDFAVEVVRSEKGM